MPPDARVSVVVPVRDGARYLGDALRSVAAQSFAAYELIVVDDGSSDDSGAIAERLGARVERQPPGGQADARNRGVELSSGELVAFLDADDLWPPGALESRVSAMRAEPAADLVFGQVRQFGPVAGDAWGAPRPGLLFGTMLVRRSALDGVGPFASEWRVGELMEWLFRARDAGVRELMIGEVVLHRRLHATNTGHDHDSRVDHVRIVRRALDRRRGRLGA
jgi:glycosyltransferase involved in cell wall biosynthesis